MPPGLTLLFAVKLEFRTIDAKPGAPAENCRWSSATSDGELTRRHVRRRECRRPARPPLVRIRREIAIHLNDYLLYIAYGCFRGDQARHTAPNDQRLLGDHE